MSTLLLLTIGVCGLRSDTLEASQQILWLSRPAAQPYLAALTAAAAESNLPVALIAELIGTESGFAATAKNAHSSARGCGQQTNGNPFIASYHLDRAKCADSIRAAALQLRAGLDRHGTLDGALRAYGTTSAMSASKRRATVARFEEAALYVPDAKIAVASR